MADETRISRFMSLVLRHDPSALGISLDPQGWTDFGAFARRMNEKFGVGETELRRLVETSSKQRFAIRDGRIRAAQGHSVEVDLALAPAEPPPILFHGTTAGALERIFAKGLIRGERHHVHLSADLSTAEQVARRWRAPWVILEVDAGGMRKGGVPFYLSENGVWLVETVPPGFLSLSRTWSA